MPPPSWLFWPAPGSAARTSQPKPTRQQGRPLWSRKRSSRASRKNYPPSLHKPLFQGRGHGTGACSPYPLVWSTGLARAGVGCQGPCPIRSCRSTGGAAGVRSTAGAGFHRRPRAPSHLVTNSALHPATTLQTLAGARERRWMRPAASGSGLMPPGRPPTRPVKIQGPLRRFPAICNNARAGSPQHVAQRTVKASPEGGVTRKVTIGAATVQRPAVVRSAGGGPISPLPTCRARCCRRHRLAAGHSAPGRRPGPWRPSRASRRGSNDGSRVIRVGLSWSRTPRTPRAARIPNPAPPSTGDPNRAQPRRPAKT